MTDPLKIPTIGDPVIFKPVPGRHEPEREGEVIGYCRARGTDYFDVRDLDGTRHDNLTEVRLDTLKQSARAKRALEAERQTAIEGNATMLFPAAFADLPANAGEGEV